MDDNLQNDELIARLLQEEFDAEEKGTYPLKLRMKQKDNHLVLLDHEGKSLKRNEDNGVPTHLKIPEQQSNLKKSISQTLQDIFQQRKVSNDKSVKEGKCGLSLYVI